VRPPRPRAGEGGICADASALLSVLLAEPGEDRVREVLDRSQMHAVNVAEVIGKLAGPVYRRLRPSRRSKTFSSRCARSWSLKRLPGSEI
jgi:PIN domain nuclease of toxin-antitoxin system